jgi:polyisoprenoid-binding protein YceI
MSLSRRHVPVFAIAVIAAAASAWASTTLDVVAPSEARYRASERLFGRPFRTPVGTTTDVAGAIVLADDGAVLPGSLVTVGLGGLTSDEPLRDAYVQSSSLRTREYPTASFAPTSVDGLPPSWPSDGSYEVTVAGELTVLGVTRTVVWQGVVTFEGGAARLEASLATTFTELGLDAPRLGTLLEVDDELSLEVSLVVRRR